ncbi:MAG: type II toxin-antitoxin system PemK/MazF family toxin [Bacteroidota bacterium]
MTKNFPKQYDIWVANLDPAFGSEPGRVRPVIILQSDLLNKSGHSSFVSCVISSQHREGVSLIRLAINPTTSNGLLKQSYALCDQVRSIDQSRLIGKVGSLDKETINRLTESIKVILSL